MAALVQGYPRQSGTVTMLQTRPASASAMMPGAPAQSNQQYGHHGSQQRTNIHGLPGGGGPVVYRGGSGPVQPYAFTNTPNLNQAAQWQQVRQYRTSSTPSVPTIQNMDYFQGPQVRPRYTASTSMTNLPSTATVGVQAVGGSRDDSALPNSSSRRGSTSRSQAQYINEQPSLPPSLAPATGTRVSPERYRRPAPRAPDSSSSGSGPQPYGAGSAMPPSNTRTVPDLKGNMLRTPIQNRPSSFVGAMTGSAVDDMQLPYGYPQDDVKRIRRRSMPALDSAVFSSPLAPLDLARPGESTRLDQSAVRKNTDKEQKLARSGNTLAIDRGTTPTDVRSGSADSRSSSRSTSRPSSSANRNSNLSNPTVNPAQASSSPDQQPGTSQDYPRLVNIPPRSSSSSDATNTKRAINPSPLSKPVAMDAKAGNRPSADTTGPASSSSPMKAASSPRLESPAVKQLAALNQNGNKSKSKTSRLRRALSFGSASEFKKVVQDGEAADGSQSNAHGKLHKERDADDLYDAEQARIAQQQEAAGIGNNIYAGGKIFAGSTDNISISSTASSASIMIRKMGRGMKKGTRSLVGLFRPKSIIGAPAADAKLPEATQAAVSMVTAEAERERVNVTADLHAQPAGGTGFPRLERNSIDAANAAIAVTERLSSSGTDNSGARKSIVGGEKERAEVLAAVRKGILKKDRSGSSSPSPKPSEARGPAFDLPHVPHVADSPNSSAPSTPNEESQKRGGQITIGSEDYFVSALRLRQDTKSAPSTPQGTMKRNATFSPRIVFYDTWPPGEYDRRGEIATCNRLTPLLAQQIKEELNNFKMEMEVHENSKIYTHFF